MSFILNPIFVYYLSDKEKMGEVSLFFPIWCSSMLFYRTEWRRFFLFYSKVEDKSKVISTSTISLFGQH